MKHAAKLATWKQRIIECRASGQPVKTWCGNNHCDPSTYYRWEREIFGRIKESATEDADILSEGEALLPAPRQELVELPLTEPVRMTPESVIQPLFSPVAVIRFGSVELSLTNAVSTRLMKQLKELFPNAK